MRNEKTYQYSVNIKENDNLRASFNALTQKTFWFNFVNWYEAGHWGDFYIPHALLDGEKVISNVSVNLMQFDICGMKKNYIQLGTVMTDEAYRGQGLNREIMEHILEEYAGKVDGIYLFGNDDVVEYYPKFGFTPSKEYEYYLPWENTGAEKLYQMKQVMMQNADEAEQLYEFLYNYKVDANATNQNDAFYMNENVNLFQFWLAAGYGDKVYQLPEIGAYVIAELDEAILRVYQVFGKQGVDMMRLAKTFVMSDAQPEAHSNAVKEIVLGYTPSQKEKYLVREHKEEDCTLFILGEDLKRIEQEKMMFSLLSHA